MSMGKKLLAILSFAMLTAGIWGQNADWLERYRKAYDSALLERKIKLSPSAAMAKNRALLEARMLSIEDPEQAGLMSARLIGEMEMDIRSGMDMQEAGARLTQSARIASGHKDGKLRLQGVESVRQKAGSSSNAKRMAGGGNAAGQKIGSEIQGGIQSGSGRGKN